jgi:hypothetical protein
MKRRAFITLLGGASVWPLAVRAQQLSEVAHIGFLRYASPHEKQFNAFRDGLGFSLAADPVADGLAASMARPGANLTGLTLTVGYQLAGKRAELLKDLKPDLSRLAVLFPPNNLTANSHLQEVEKVGRSLGLSIRAFAAQNLDDLPRAFAAMVEWQANGVITLNDAFFFSQREHVVALTVGNKLAAVHRMLGLTVSREFLLRADELIE